MIESAKWNEVPIANPMRRAMRRTMRTSMMCLSFAVLACGNLACRSLWAQDPFGATDPAVATDPFGNAPSPAMAADAPPTEPAFAATDAPAEAEEVPDSLVKLLRLSPPKSARDYAQALDLMSRVNRWGEVARTFDTLQKANWNREQLSELSSVGGPALWSRLSDRDNPLTDAQKKIARDISALPGQMARDPKWIDQMIDRLGSPSTLERHAATIQLQRSHRAGIERLCSRLLTGDPSVAGSRLVEALLHFDADGIEALRSASVAKDSNSRTRVLLALAESNSTEFSMELSSAPECSLLSDQARLAISDRLLKRYAQLPSSAKVREYLVMRFKRQLEEYQQARAQAARVPVTIWRMAADGRVVAVEGTAKDKALEGLARMAALRIAYASRTQEDLLDCVTVLLQHSYQVQPGVKIADPTGALLSGLPEEASGSGFWKKIFDRSNALQMHGAATRATQAIGKELATSSVGSSTFDYIARALRDSRPVIRYVAVDAISRANLQTDYNGSATAIETAIEMSRLGEGPTVLVVGLTSDLRLAAEQQLLSMGSPSLSANSLSSALEILNQPNPVEMIMVVDRVMGYSLRGLVERLRHSRRGQSLPVSVLTEQLEISEANELARMPGVVLSVLSHDKSQMPRVVREMERRMDVRPLSTEERMSFVESAQQLLNSTSSDGLGTASSQENWIRIASDATANKEARMQAAQSFSKSIKRNGLLLSPASQVKAYEIYNLQGPSDSVTIGALGSILDAIETITGPGEATTTP